MACALVSRNRAVDWPSSATKSNCIGKVRKYWLKWCCFYCGGCSHGLPRPIP